jgi:hypothetical protein
MFRRPVAVVVGCGNGIAPWRAAEMCYDVWGGEGMTAHIPTLVDFPLSPKNKTS